MSAHAMAGGPVGSVDCAPSRTDMNGPMTDLVRYGLALLAGIVAGMLLIGAWIKCGRG